MCGKNQNAKVVSSILLGSPPHVREKLANTAKHSRKLRITPACAGKTLVDLSAKPLYRDHPRMCGKNRHDSK